MKKSALVVIVCLSFIASAVAVYYALFKTKKTAYIKSETVFNEFKLTKELKASYQNTENTRKAILDSLVISLKMQAAQLQSTPQKSELKQMFNLRQEEYLRKKQEFEEDNARLSNEYNQQIWTRINQYAKEYGEKNGYEYIYGANGDGSLMYVNENFDITDAFVSFMNDQYQGK